MLTILRTQALVLVLQNIGNACAYLFQIVLARSMSVAEFGGFNALFSLSLLLAAPCFALQMGFSKRAVILSLTGPEFVAELLRRRLRAVLAFSAVVVLTVAGLSQVLGESIRAESPFQVLLTALIVCTTLIHALVLGAAQGLRRYVLLGASGSAVPLARLAGGLLLVTWLGLGISGALWGCLLGTLAGLLFGLWAIRDLFGHASSAFPDGLRPDSWRGDWPLFACYMLVMVLGNIDVLLVRHFCTPDQSGLYASAALIGRISLLLPAALTNVLFPEAVRARQGSTAHGRLLWSFLGTTFLLGGSVTLVCFLWPEQILAALMGKAYSDATVLPYVSLAMTLLATANALFTYYLARNELAFLVPLLVGTGLFIGATMSWHDSPTQIAILLLLSVAFIVATSLALPRAWYRTYTR